MTATKSRIRRIGYTAAAAALIFFPEIARADESGISFWLPGTGYAYQQITDDFGQPANFGGFRSRVFGMGPQVGCIFKIGENDAFLGVKGYGEFAAENRPSGWNTWPTFSISEAVPAAVAPTKHLVRK